MGLNASNVIRAVRGPFHHIPGLRRFSPSQVLLMGFAAVILTGSLLLYLPVASRPGRPLAYIDALFTSTSATCVTGLVTVSTHDQYSWFGQIVTMLLIQVGGLGLMTMSTLMALLLGRRISFRSRILIAESLNQFTPAGMVRLVKAVVAATAIVEGAGALALSTVFVPRLGPVEGIFHSVYHAVSAFCNAGFSLTQGFRNLEVYKTSVVVNLTVTSLVIIGGIGFAVIVDVVTNRRWVGLSLHSKLALTVTACLILFGTSLILILEAGNPATMGGLSAPQKVMAAYFQAVTPRTAGFNTIPISKMRNATVLITILLMFIGASPGSTGGGIKTTTFGTLVAAVLAIARGRDDVEMFHKRLSFKVVYKAMAVAAMSAMLVVLVTIVLTLTDLDKLVLHVLFEVTSAFGTVGLSTGITPNLSTAAKIALVLTMFSGRLGPLTVAVAITHRQMAGPAPVRHPEDRVMIG